MKLQKYSNRIRDRLANRLLNYLLKKRVNNKIILSVSFRIYFLLTRGLYIRTHKIASHHYVPRFLLKNFRIGNTGKIFEYKKGKRPVAISINKKAALAPNLYSFRDKKTKQQSDFIEDVIFARTLERYAPRIIARILNDDINLTHLENSILASFVSFQYTRTPYFLFQLEKMLVYFMRGKSVKLEETAKKDFFEKGFFKNYLNVDRDDITRFNRHNKERLGGVENLLLRMSQQIANHLSKSIFYTNLYLLSVSEPDFFFITDHPVVMFSPRNKNFIGPMFWEMGRDSVIFLPLSPTKGIYYAYKSLDGIANDLYGFFRELSLHNKYVSIYSDRKSNTIDNFLQNN